MNLLIKVFFFVLLNSAPIADLIFVYKNIGVCQYLQKKGEVDRKSTWHSVPLNKCMMEKLFQYKNLIFLNFVTRNFAMLDFWKI